MASPDLFLRALAAALAILGASACGGGNAASQLGGPPAFAPRDQAKCGVARSQGRPLIVEWPAADRASLESHARHGLVAVRYDGCEMEVLPRCRANGRYVYAGLTRKQDHVVMRDADDLYANIPVHAASFEAKLQKVGQLNVSLTIVGQYESDKLEVKVGNLEGACEGATHVVTALTAGAFEFYAGSDAEVGGGVSVANAGAGAHSSALRETLNHDGDDKACVKATTQDHEPPEGCGALLRVEVAPILGAKSPTPAPGHPATSSAAVASTDAAAPAPLRDDEGCPENYKRITGGSMLLADNAPVQKQYLGDGPPPARRVHVDAYCLQPLEVSANEFTQCILAGHCSAEELRCGPKATYPNGGNLPINCVSAEDAAHYCAWRKVRLPTEDEWEWAARGGARAWLYPWGDRPEDVPHFMTGELIESYRGSQNPDDVRSLVGNVWEWTSTEIAGARIIRGGGYADKKPELFAVRTSRLSRKAGERKEDLGFRCAR